MGYGHKQDAEAPPRQVGSPVYEPSNRPKNELCKRDIHIKGTSVSLLVLWWYFAIAYVDG